MRYVSLNPTAGVLDQIQGIDTYLVYPYIDTEPKSLSRCWVDVASRCMRVAPRKHISTQSGRRDDEGRARVRTTARRVL